MKPRRLSASRQRARAFLLFAAAALAGCSQSQPEPAAEATTSPPAASSDIRLEAGDGSTPTAELRAELLGDLTALPKPSGTARLLAAGRFGPAGTRFPAGLKVTWPLNEEFAAGARLWIVTLDEARAKWVGTGETALVADDRRSASGIVRHFSDIGLQDAVPESFELPSVDQATSPVAAQRCVRPVQSSADQEALARAWNILKCIQWKRDRKLFDYRPDGESQRWLSALGELPEETIRRLTGSIERAALVEVKRGYDFDYRVYLLEQIPPALDPAELFKTTIEKSTPVLEESKRMLTDGLLSQVIEQELQQVQNDIDAALWSIANANPDGSRDRSLMLRHKELTQRKGRALAMKSEIERSEKSIKRSLEALEYLEKAGELCEAASSDDPGAAFGVTKAVVELVEQYTGDPFDDAKELYEDKIFETEGTRRAFDRIRPDVRGRGAGLRGYHYQQLVGADQAGVDALNAERKALVQLNHAATVRQVLDGAKTILDTLQKSLAAYEEIRKQIDAMEKDLAPLASRMDERTQGFARYFTAVAAMIKGVFGIAEPLTEASPTAQVIVEILTSSADAFEELGKFPLTAQKLHNAFTQGIAESEDSPDGLMYPLELFTENSDWGLMAYKIDDSAFVVPGDRKDASLHVKLNPQQYEETLLVASLLTSLRARNLGQAEFRETASAVASGDLNLKITYQAWDGVVFEQQERVLTREELLTDEGRAQIDEEAGAMYLRYEQITRGLTIEEIEAVELAKLVTVGEDGDEARKIFVRYNDIWRRLDEAYRAVYGVPVTSTVFAAVQQHESRVKRKEGDVSTYAPLEQRLVRLREELRREQFPEARVLATTVARPDWNRLETRMVYVTHGLKPADEVCRYFRLKFGDRDWIELNPQTAIDTPAGSQVSAKLEGLLPDDLLPGVVRVEGVVSVNGRQAATGETELWFDPPFRFLSFDVTPRRLESEGRAFLDLTAYVDEDFLADVTPAVEFTLQASGGPQLKAPVALENLTYFNGHTLHATAEINLPKWPDRTTVTATAAVSFGDVTQQQQLYLETGELKSQPSAPTATAAATPAAGATAGSPQAQVKVVRSAELATAYRFERTRSTTVKGVKRVLEYKGWMVDGKRLAKSGDVGPTDKRKVIRSSAYVFLETDTGTVGGTMNFAKERMPGSGEKTTDRYKANLFSHVSYNWKPPEAARGTIIVGGDTKYEGVDEEGISIWADNFAIALYRGDDLKIPGYPEFQKHFIVVFNHGKPSEAVREQILKAQRDELPDGIMAILSPSDE